MRSARWLYWVLVFAFVSTLALSQVTPPPKKITITGTLSRITAIGGETSGWSLELQQPITLEGKKMRSVEIMGPSDKLEQLKDQRVRAKGTLVHHTGMERGDYLVLEVTSITAVK